MFRHAASYFGDPEAQYQVGRMYLEGAGTPKDAVQASRWLRLAADMGQRNAQALLGAMLFKGKDVSRQAAMGLFWLTVAKDAVAKEGGGSDDKWITDTYSSGIRPGDRGRARRWRTAISSAGCESGASVRIRSSRSRF